MGGPDGRQQAAGGGRAGLLSPCVAYFAVIKLALMVCCKWWPLLQVTDNSTVTQVRCEYDNVERLEVVAGIAEVEEPAKPAMPVADVDVPPAQVEDHPMTEVRTLTNPSVT